VLFSGTGWEERNATIAAGDSADLNVAGIRG
jgi:hypothetical protein